MEHAHTVLSETWSFSGQLIGWTLQKGTGRSCFWMIYGYYYICLIERATWSQMKEKPLQISLPGLENHHRYLFNPSHLQWNTNTVTSKNTCDLSWRKNKGNQSDGLLGFTRWFWCGIGPFLLLQPQAEDRKAVTKKPESYVLSSQEHQVMQNGFGEQIPSCARKSPHCKTGHCRASVQKLR